MKKCASLLLIPLLLCPTIQLATQSSLGLADNIYYSLISVGSMFGLGVVTTTAHEMGHAVTADMLWDNPIAITVGSHNYYGEGLNYDAGLINLVFGVPGAAFMEIDTAKKPRLEQLAMYAAGPICGTLSSLLMYCLLKKVTPDSLFGSRIATQRELKQLLAIMCYVHLSNFLPYYGSENSVSDGAQIAIAYNLIERKSVKPITWYLKQVVDVLAIGLISWKVK